MSKYLFFTAAMFFSIVFANAKADNPKGVCSTLPMKSGSFAIKTSPGGEMIINSSDNQVNSLTIGAVTSVFKTQDLNTVIVRFAADSFVTYSRLAVVKVKKGDQITKGEIIGSGMASPLAGKNEMGLSIYYRLNGPKPMTAEALAAFIERVNK